MKDYLIIFACLLLVGNLIGGAVYVIIAYERPAQQKACASIGAERYPMFRSDPLCKKPDGSLWAMP